MEPRYGFSYTRFCFTLTLFRGGYLPSYSRGCVVNLPELCFLWRNTAMVMKLGSINNYHKNFRFPSKKFTVVMTSSDFADDVIKIGVFDGFSGVPGKNCAVTWVFVAWSWLTPHFKARRLLYTVQLHWLASLIEKSHFGADLIPIIVKIRLKSDKIRQIDVIWRHDVGFS